MFVPVAPVTVAAKGNGLGVEHRTNALQDADDVYHQRSGARHARVPSKTRPASSCAVLPYSHDGNQLADALLPSPGRFDAWNGSLCLVPDAAGFRRL